MVSYLVSRMVRFTNRNPKLYTKCFHCNTDIMLKNGVWKHVKNDFCLCSGGVAVAEPLNEEW